MPERLFRVSLILYAGPQQAVTDTAPAIPVYYYHSFEQPFCADARCLCHMHQQDVASLFVHIVEGHLLLESVATFLDKQGKEGRA